MAPRTLATAYKLLPTTVAMLRDNRPYIDPGIDDKLLLDRNAARWLRCSNSTDICKVSVPSCSRRQPEPDAIFSHLRRWRDAGADTDRGCRHGLTIRRLVGQEWLPAELRDRGIVGEVCLH